MAISQVSRLFVSLFVVLLLSGASIAPKPALAIGTADLAVSLTPSKNHLKFGETMSLSITVKHLGPDAATGVEVSVGVSDSYANFGGSCPDGTVSSMCSLGTLASGAVITFPYFVGACCACCPDRVGVAVASVNHDADTVDPVVENNQARVETRLTGKPPF